MLAAFDGWVRSSRAEGLRLLAVEHPVQVELTPQVGPRLRLRGRVDRLEVDASGRPVVIDVKTGKTALSKQAAAEHPQLAVYQLAAALGAFRELLDPQSPPGGARLVYVADQKAGGEAKEPVQPPLEPDDLARWQQELFRVAGETSGEHFIARVGPDCDRCPVRTSCPVNESGRAVPEP
jgi:RecB family exonuclease